MAVVSQDRFHGSNHIPILQCLPVMPDEDFTPGLSLIIGTQFCPTPTLNAGQLVSKPNGSPSQRERAPKMKLIGSIIFLRYFDNRNLHRLKVLSLGERKTRPTTNFRV